VNDYMNGCVCAVMNGIMWPTNFFWSHQQICLFSAYRFM